MSEATQAFGVPLNEQQRRAVEHGEGPLLVVAGAGTGKTRIIVERIRYLLENNPSLSGENILGLTFTDKAAGEMKWRVERAVGERGKGVWLSTFHKFCLEKILQQEKPDAVALDEIGHWILLRRNLTALGLERFKKLAEPGQYLSDFVKFFSRCQDELVTPGDYQSYVEGLRRNYEAQKAELDAEARARREEELSRQQELARAYSVSERLLREHGLLTFGAQILQAVERMRQDGALRTRLCEQFRYVLVDEFQDTNIAQLELLWLLAGESAGQSNIVAVGDDDQAIYRFRGASFGSFKIFLERFCGASSGSASNEKFQIALAENYRSTKRILRVASQVIAQNERSPYSGPKKLVTENAEGEPIRILEFVAPQEEAEWIARELERRHAAGVKWRSFAVLYRKHSARERLVEVLRRERIPFVIRKFSILGSTLIRDLIAYLRWIGKPADNIACARVLAVPYWGLKPQDVIRLAERAAKNRGASLGDALDAAQAELPFSGDRSRAEELRKVIAELRQKARRAPASALFGELRDVLGLAPLPAESEALYLERFEEFLGDWEAASEKKSLRDFLGYLDYFNEAGGQIDLDQETSDDAVQLMTVHAAKGLEFPHVFVMRVAEGDFPARARRALFEFPPELMKEEKPKGDFHIQEERRLFYVALTRAQRDLTLTTVTSKRQKQSAFLEDILMEPQLKLRDTRQLAPDVPLLPEVKATGAAPINAARPLLFPAGDEHTRVYSRIALWAKAFHPPQPEPLQLSASAIETYEQCPMKYQFQQVWRIRGGPHAATTFGSVLHTTIKEFMRELKEKRKISLEEVFGTYEREWSGAGFLDEYQENEYHNAGREQLTAFYGTAIESPAEVLYQEKPFELPLADRVIILGRMDQVNRLGGKRVEIVDYKTGKPQDARQAAKSLQLSLYALAAREVLGLVPERLAFYNLTSNEAVVTTRDAKQLQNAEERVGEVADRIRGADFPAKPGFLCRTCDYQPLCPAHEELILIQTRVAAKEMRGNG